MRGDARRGDERRERGAWTSRIYIIYTIREKCDIIKQKNR
jgi:hypothetical protein